MSHPKDIVTGERSTCVNCRSHIIAVIDGSSGCVDWGVEDRKHRGDPGWLDFGCDASPDTTDDGCGSHNPGRDHTPCGFKILVDSKSYWERIEAREKANT